MIRRNGLLGVVALLVVGAVVGTMVAACGIRPSVVIPGQDAPQGAVTSTILYLIDHNALRPVSRPLPPTTAPNIKPTAGYISPQEQALTALAQGPSATEAAGGLTSDIPTDVALKFTYDDNIGNNIGNIVFAFKPDKQPFTQHAVDQIVCTVVASMTSSGGSSDGGRIQVTVDDVGHRWPKQGCPASTP